MNLAIKIIKFKKNSYYNKELNNLPTQLEILELPERYNLKIKNIYPNCKIVRNIHKYRHQIRFIEK